MNQMLALRPQGCPPGVDPREWRRAVELRIEELHDAQLALLGALDQMDGDPDLEPSLDDEFATWLESGIGRIGSEQMTVGDDMEQAEADEDDGTTREPSLGAPDSGGDAHQERWAEGRRGDHECELDTDAEPSLGWISRDNGGVTFGADGDLEAVYSRR